MTIPPPNFPPPEPPAGPPSRSGPPPRRPARLLGGLAAAAYVVALLVVVLSWSSSFDVLVFGVLVGVVAATVAIARENLRPYAVGFLIGLATIVIVGAGACIGLIAIVSAEH